MTPSAFIFLYENQLFLTFRNRTVAVWNFRGELVTKFEDHLLWHPDCNTNNIYITSDQDLIISYCKADAEEPLSDGNGKRRKHKKMEQFAWVCVGCVQNLANVCTFNCTRLIMYLYSVIGTCYCSWVYQYKQYLDREVSCKDKGKQQSPHERVQL